MQKLHQQVVKTFADQVTPVRLASHLSVLAVAALILILSRVEMPDWSFSFRAFPDSALLDSSNGAASRVTALVNQQNGGGITGSESLQRAAVPFTIVHQPPTAEGIQVYTVQPGDTVLAIAEKHGINPETIMWSNPGLELNADLIRPGDKLNILPVNGVLHTITSGDTLISIADKYKVTVEDILNYPGNGLTDPNSQLTIGNQLVIPNGTKPFVVQEAVAYSGGAVPASAKIGSGAFVWPTSGSINQRFWSGHAGVDIGGWTGAPVKAADGGYVAVAAGGWNGGYGNHVIVDHGNGFVTLYAHLNSIYVKPGESVTRGQQIGSIGNTGNSTGPHLHFELRYQGVPRNPLSYLP
ncbi:MAG TPA: peptidoglycan DD-metalloendopeptidase family protein [Caldilineaceae bacterium]|nr:peptidoglycan DD-metalloendopeptidase family protein [Caldilineaceae bacterium]